MEFKNWPKTAVQKVLSTCAQTSYTERMETWWADVPMLPHQVLTQSLTKEIEAEKAEGILWKSKTSYFNELLVGEGQNNQQNGVNK